VTRDNDIVVIDIEANAFLHHMVRNIAGVLIAIGTGKQPVEWSREVLEARDRTLAGVTAPPDGLYLFDIKYPQMFRIPSVIESKTSLLELITGYRDSRHTS
jgi:tRNA pseudouridine38-40 synthase